MVPAEPGVFKGAAIMPSTPPAAAIIPVSGPGLIAINVNLQQESPLDLLFAQALAMYLLHRWLGSSEGRVRGYAACYLATLLLELAGNAELAEAERSRLPGQFAGVARIAHGHQFDVGRPRRTGQQAQ
jgi:hypothetical protein